MQLKTETHNFFETCFSLTGFTSLLLKCIIYEQNIETWKVPGVSISEFKFDEENI